MKITVTESMFIEQFKRVRPENFSRKALEALFEHYYVSEQETGKEFELDVIEVCCNWTEYDDVIEAAENYGFKREEGDDERADISDRKALEFLRDNTWVLDLDGDGVVVLNY